MQLSTPKTERKGERIERGGVNGGKKKTERKRRGERDRMERNVKERIKSLFYPNVLS